MSDGLKDKEVNQERAKLRKGVFISLSLGLSPRPVLMHFWKEILFFS